MMNWRVLPARRPSLLNKGIFELVHKIFGYSSSDGGYAIMVTTIFLFSGAILAWRHEMWRDEVWAWLIARDSSSIIALFRKIEFQGHPGLWYVCLYLLKFITRSPIIMQVFHLLIAGTTVYLFVRFSPFTRLQKILFAFGYFPFYEYSVICRNYALGVLLLFLFCVLFQERSGRFPLLGLVLFFVAHTSVHAAICALSIFLALLLDYFYTGLRDKAQKGKVTTGIVFFFIILGLVTVAIQLNHPWSSGAFIRPLPKFKAKSFFDIFDIMPRAFFLITHLIQQKFPLLFSLLRTSKTLRIVLSSLIVLWAITFLLRKPTALLMYVSGTVGLLIFFGTIHQGAIRHHGFLFIIFLVSVWVSRSDGKISPIILNHDAKLSPQRHYLFWTPRQIVSKTNERFPPYMQNLYNIFNRISSVKYQNVVLTLVLIVHITGGILAAARDYKYPFSQGKAVARYLREANLDNNPIVYSARGVFVPITGYLGKKTYYQRKMSDDDTLSPYSTALNTGFETLSEPKSAVFEPKMIASKKDDPVLKRSNKIRRGVENRLRKAKELSAKSGESVLIILNHSLPKDVISRYSLTEEKRFEGAIVEDEVYYLYIADEYK